MAQTDLKIGKHCQEERGTSGFGSSGTSQVFWTQEVTTEVYNDDPTWIDQWPITQEKLTKIHELIAQQLQSRTY